MDLPGLIMSPYSAQLGLLSLLFVMMAINDIIPLLEKNKKFFESIVPLRLMVFFVVTMLSYFWTENLYLHNNAVFIYSMSEIWINFLIFNAIRDEKNESFKNQNRFNAEEPVEELDEIDEVDIVMTSSQEIEEATYEEE